MRSKRALVACCVLAACACLSAAPAAAAGFRTIASVSLDTYFDGSWLLESSDVVLVRLIPALTIQAKYDRMDSPGRAVNTVSLGPVVSFTDTLYLAASYGLGIQSEGGFMHEAAADFNFETDTSSASVGLKADFFPAAGYYYFLPSISGMFHPLSALGLFGKFFLSVDSEGTLTESFWGEADYAFSKIFDARLGFTVSMSGAFGFSVIGGASLAFTDWLGLKYEISYLSNTLEYLTAPETQSGIRNLIVVDVKL